MTVAGLAGALLLWGAPADAISGAPPQGVLAFWTREERPVRLRLLSPAARRTGQGIFMRATIALDESCVYPGPIFEVGDVPVGSPRRFRAHIWRQHGVPCDRIGRLVEQPVHLWTETPGTIRFDSGQRTVIELKVTGEPPRVPLEDRPRPCRVDEDCWVTDVCVPRRADPGATGICGQICGDGLDCASQRCDSDAGIVGVCKDPGAPCDKNHPCSWGQICSGHGVVSRCRWATELAAATRGPCASDGDCGAGLKCFKRDGATAPRGRCEMLCSSAQMTCTGAHQCSDEGICEWLGE